MKNNNIIRAWKDQAYRNSLTPEQRAALPANPAGSVELSGEQMQRVTGGAALVVQEALAFARSRKGSSLCNSSHVAAAAM